jgi:alpha-1,2-mannosyltransferase
VLAHVAEAPGSMISMLGVLTTHRVPTWLAYTAQAGVSLLVCAVPMLTIRRFRGAPAKAACVSACVILASPSLHCYDMAILLRAACWLIADGMRTGFRPWEKILLLVLCCLPIMYFMPVMAARAPIDLLLVAWLLAMLWRRAGTANPGRTALA